MEEEVIMAECDFSHPVLVIPKNLTMLETDCKDNDNVFINLNITSQDSLGNHMSIYSGYCKVKIIDSVGRELDDMYVISDLDNVLGEITLPDTESDNPTDMLIDPTHNPYVNNDYNCMESEERYSVYQSNGKRISMRHCSMYVKQDGHNYREVTNSSQCMEFEHKKFGRVPMISDDDDYIQQSPQLNVDPSINETILANESEALQEMNDMNMASESDAVKQLMSSDLQTLPKTQRTILYLGESAQLGQTLQTIAFTDPQVTCLASADCGFTDNNYDRKKYQCEKCKQIFYHITAFKKHIHIKHKPACEDPGNFCFLCIKCNKTFKSNDKFEAHCLGHGNPELECQMCNKVFASKLSLKTHNKIHLRPHKCPYCKRTYQVPNGLQKHLERVHYVFKCDICEYTSSKIGLEKHKREHDVPWTPPVDGDVMTWDAWTDDDVTNEDYSIRDDQNQEHDSVIARVMMDKMFLMQSNKTKKFRIKSCSICDKSFDRISDLKRHLIEHILRSTLAKNPVSDIGVLAITCEICQSQTFSRVDKYKAHLRDHAKLTTYKCTFCDKTFSDSSNFSKHKKIHGTKYFQCDLCQRKFNSKKTLIQHIHYHNTSTPKQCNYCKKEFYFPSSLTKHLKVAHRHVLVQYKCKFCEKKSTSLKEKWDHEWLVHNIRKLIVDCNVCGSKFRKYSELKRHCLDYGCKPYGLRDSTN